MNIPEGLNVSVNRYQYRCLGN